MNEPFRRQPLPVEVEITGESWEDVEYWRIELMHRAEFKGDQTQILSDGREGFKIFPRAVND